MKKNPYTDRNLTNFTKKVLFVTCGEKSVLNQDSNVVPMAYRDSVNRWAIEARYIDWQSHMCNDFIRHNSLHYQLLKPFFLYFICQVSLNLINRYTCSYKLQIFMAHPFQHFNFKTQRHGDICFTAFQDTPLHISQTVCGSWFTH